MSSDLLEPVVTGSFLFVFGLELPSRFPVQILQLLVRLEALDLSNVTKDRVDSLNMKEMKTIQTKAINKYLKRSVY